MAARAFIHVRKERPGCMRRAISISLVLQLCTQDGLLFGADHS
jgi:hypothetical protein